MKLFYKIALSAVIIAVTMHSEPTINHLLREKCALEDLQDRFFKAIKEKNIEATKELIAQGADVNARNSKGKTPLMCACEYPNAAGTDEIIEILIAAGADVNAMNSDPLSPFLII